MPINNRKYKDSVFTDLFGSDRDAKKNFLSLYNALSGNSFKLEEVNLERKVIEQSLYKTFNNDVSWEIDDQLIVLVEHQSTINNNMPLRCLEYITRIYEGIVPTEKRYAEKTFKLPAPDFYVVYVGKKEQPLETELHLSDAYYRKDSAKLELIVNVKNCTDPKILPIKGNCDILKEYCQFIEIVEKTYSRRFPKRSFRKAIEIAVSKNILSDYLNRKSREVINMLCAKYDYKMDIAVKKEEAFQDGMEAGLEKGSQQKAVEDAANLLKLGVLTEEQISSAIGLPLEQVIEIKNSLTVNA